MSAETLKWGLCGVAVCMLFTYGIQASDSNLQQTIKFINDDASSVHGALRVGSIYTSESGEWRIGGFEVLSSMKDDEAIIYVCYQWQTGPTHN
jgi:SCY1-like protein 1